MQYSCAKHDCHNGKKKIEEKRLGRAANVGDAKVHHLPKFSFLHVTPSPSHAFATACAKQRWNKSQTGWGPKLPFVDNLKTITSNATHGRTPSAHADRQAGTERENLIANKQTG